MNLLEYLFWNLLFSNTYLDFLYHLRSVQWGWKLMFIVRVSPFDLFCIVYIVNQETFFENANVSKSILKCVVINWYKMNRFIITFLEGKMARMI